MGAPSRLSPLVESHLHVTNSKQPPPRFGAESQGAASASFLDSGLDGWSSIQQQTNRVEQGLPLARMRPKVAILLGVEPDLEGGRNTSIFCRHFCSGCCRSACAAKSRIGLVFPDCEAGGGKQGISVFDRWTPSY